MLVREAMSTVVLTIGPAHTLRQAAALMSARRVGAAVVYDPDAGGIGILTERDVLVSVGTGQDPDIERAHAHTTTDVVFAAPSGPWRRRPGRWRTAASATSSSSTAASPRGIVSVRDIIRCWAPERSRPRGTGGDRLTTARRRHSADTTNGPDPRTRGSGPPLRQAVQCWTSAAQGLDRGLQPLAGSPSA